SVKALAWRSRKSSRTVDTPLCSTPRSFSVIGITETIQSSDHAIPVGKPIPLLLELTSNPCNSRRKTGTHFSWNRPLSHGILDGKPVPTFPGIDLYPMQ